MLAYLYGSILDTHVHYCIYWLLEDFQNEGTPNRLLFPALEVTGMDFQDTESVGAQQETAQTLFPFKIKGQFSAKVEV